MRFLDPLNNKTFDDIFNILPGVHECGWTGATVLHGVEAICSHEPVAELALHGVTDPGIPHWKPRLLVRRRPKFAAEKSRSEEVVAEAPAKALPCRQGVLTNVVIAGLAMDLDWTVHLVVDIHGASWQPGGMMYKERQNSKCYDHRGRHFREVASHLICTTATITQLIQLNSEQGQHYSTAYANPIN
jgi:hypothetical protein